MHLKKLSLRNFRRLKDVTIDLDEEISIFVGANNSGKTSVGHALQLFTGRSNFSLHDFSVELWPGIDAFGEDSDGGSLPSISLDLWFQVDDADLQRVIDMLPSLFWENNLVGLRVAYSPIDPDATLACYREARGQALAAVARNDDGEPVFDPSPRTLRDYLSGTLSQHYELRYYVLDISQFGPDMRAQPGYEPAPLVTGRNRSGRDILNALIRIDFLHAQRHLSDSAGGTRAEELSRLLSRFYGRNLEQRVDDLTTLRALTESEVAFNDHLSRVFEPTLKFLADFGYPGPNNPHLVIKTALDPESIMNSRKGARVHYALGKSDGETEPPTLPDLYNGLGFKNLIFMVVELLDLHKQWQSVAEHRPPLHLIFIEEPEAHLHAQLQQTFVRKVLAILALGEEKGSHYRSQLVITTHSSHILYERGFRPIRYFRRNQVEHVPSSTVLNLSHFYEETAREISHFLERYLRLTHCDLFFADAAILVEGNVERLLLPQMIETAAPRLQSTYLTILEIGGAFGHRFRTLIDFLGITALIITDLDSVHGPADMPEEEPPPAAIDAQDAQDEEGEVDAGEDDEEDEESEGKAGSACLADVDGAVTSNQTLIQWLPGRYKVAELFEASEDDKIKLRASEAEALVRVCYQCRIEARWRDETRFMAGRTLEETFALENLEWTQHPDRAALKLRMRGKAKDSLQTMAQGLHARVNGSGFSKTDFALALLMEDPKKWRVPEYIAEGLKWLEAIVSPAKSSSDEDAVNDDESSEARAEYDELARLDSEVARP